MGAAENCDLTARSNAFFYGKLNIAQLIEFLNNIYFNG
jgi:hypothetical protein